jgi:hypothetical protein
MGGTYSGDAGMRRIHASWVHRCRSAVFRRGHVTDDLPESSPEVRPSRVTLKTVFTACFGVLIVLGLVMALQIIVREVLRVRRQQLKVQRTEVCCHID